MFTYYTYEVFDASGNPYLYSGQYDTMRMAMKSISNTLAICPIRHYTVVTKHVLDDNVDVERTPIARTTKVEDLYKGRCITISL